MPKSIYILGLVALLFGSSCETEVDITAEYERIPVVFGLLDINASEQYILINRTFLGNGNALEFAQIQDSVLFDNVEAYIRWNPHNNTNAPIVNGMAQVQLQEVTLEEPRDEGLFFTDSPVAYTTSFDFAEEANDAPDRADFLLETRFELFAIADGDTIRASTRLADTDGLFGTGVFQSPVANQDLNLVQSFALDGSNYFSNAFNPEWNSSPTFQVLNAVKQTLSVEFNYEEFYTDGTSQERVLTIPYQTVDLSAANDLGSLGDSKSGEWFFRQLMERIDRPDNVRYRAVGDLRLKLDVAGEDFTTYLNIGDPISSVGQQRPTFSNINDGEGLGIFSSRTTYRLPVLLFDQGNEPDINEMARGIFTNDLCFCDPTPGSTFDCNDPANQCQ